MSKTIRVVVVALGLTGVAAVAARKAGMWGDNSSGSGANSAALPLTCRLRGHGWKTSGTVGQAPTRRTCQKCQRIDLPMP